MPDSITISTSVLAGFVSPFILAFIIFTFRKFFAKNICPAIILSLISLVGILAINRFNQHTKQFHKFQAQMQSIPKEWKEICETNAVMIKEQNYMLSAAYLKKVSLQELPLLSHTQYNCIMKTLNCDAEMFAKFLDLSSIGK